MHHLEPIERIYLDTKTSEPKFLPHGAEWSEAKPVSDLGASVKDGLKRWAELRSIEVKHMRNPRIGPHNCEVAMANLFAAFRRLDSEVTEEILDERAKQEAGR